MRGTGSYWPWIAVMLAASCNGGAEGAGGAAGGAAPGGAAAGGAAAGAQSGNAAGDAAALGIAFGLPRAVAAAVQSSRSMVVEAVYFACAQNGFALTGQVTKTGTVTVTQLGAQYAPAPADKLVVQIGDQVHEFEAIDATVNPQADSATAYLQAPHRLAYLHRLRGKAEARIDERFDGGRFESSVDGWTELGGVRYEVALKARGGGQGNSGLDGAESQTSYELAGTVRGGGVEVDVRERHGYSYASAVSLNLLYSQRGWASRFDATIGSTVRAGGVSFRFADVRVQTDAKEKGGRRTEDVVSTSGAILRNDRPFAEVTQQGGVAVAVASGKAIPLALPVN
jgi:hypothetical protein